MSVATGAILAGSRRRRLIRSGLLTLTILYVAVLLLAPLLGIIWIAFRQGFAAMGATFSDPQVQHAGISHPHHHRSYGDGHSHLRRRRRLAAGTRQLQGPLPLGCPRRSSVRSLSDHRGGHGLFALQPGRPLRASLHLTWDTGAVRGSRNGACNDLHLHPLCGSRRCARSS